MSDKQTEVKIEGRARTETGKGYARKLRKTGYIPANIIGKGQASMVEIEAKWLSRAWQNGKSFKLVMDGAEKAVTIKELQIHPVKRSAIHVDLMYS